jgi:hypothetical protein
MIFIALASRVFSFYTMVAGEEQIDALILHAVAHAFTGSQAIYVDAARVELVLRQLDLISQWLKGSRL